MVRPTVKDVLSYLRPAQIFLVRHEGPFSFAIRDYTDSPWSHATLIARAYPDNWLALEASYQRGCSACALARYFNDPTYSALALYEPPGLTESHRDAIVDAAWNNTVTGDYSDVSMLTTAFGLYVQDEARHSFNCAAFVEDAYQKGFRSLIDPSYPTPQALSEASDPVWVWGGIR